MAKGKSLQQQAASIVAAQLNPQIGAIGQQIKQSQGSEKQGLADIGKFFGQAGSAIGRSQGAVGAENADALGDIARLYSGAQQGQAQAYNQGRQGIAGELTRLGLQAALPGAQQRLNSDAGFMQGLTQLQGANAGANSRQMGANMAGLVNAVGGETAASGAQSKSELQHDMQRMIDNLTFQKNSMEATRGGKEQEVLSGLQQAAAAQAYKNAQLGLSQAHLGIAAENAKTSRMNAERPRGQSSAIPKGLYGANQLLGSLQRTAQNPHGLAPSTIINYQNAIGNFTGASSYTEALGQLNKYIDQYSAAKGKGTITPQDAANLKTALDLAFTH